MKKIVFAFMLSFCFIISGIGLIGCHKNNSDTSSNISQPSKPDTEDENNSEEIQPDEIVFEKELQDSIVENIKLWLTYCGVIETDGKVYDLQSEKDKFTLTINLEDYDFLDEFTTVDCINSALKESITQSCYTTDINYDFPKVTVIICKI